MPGRQEMEIVDGCLGDALAMTDFPHPDAILRADDGFAGGQAIQQAMLRRNTHRRAGCPGRGRHSAGRRDAGSGGVRPALPSRVDGSMPGAGYSMRRGQTAVDTRQTGAKKVGVGKVRAPANSGRSYSFLWGPRWPNCQPVPDEAEYAVKSSVSTSGRSPPAMGSRRRVRSFVRVMTRPERARALPVRISSVAMPKPVTKSSVRLRRRSAGRRESMKPRAEPLRTGCIPLTVDSGLRTPYLAVVGTPPG